MVKLYLESTSELVEGLEAQASRNYTLLDQQAVVTPAPSTCPGQHVDFSLLNRHIGFDRSIRPGRIRGTNTGSGRTQPTTEPKTASFRLV